MTTILLLIIVIATISLAIDPEKAVISIPFNIAGNEGEVVQVELSFGLLESSLEIKVTRFCEAHNIQAHFCRKVYDAAYSKLKEEQKRHFLKHVTNDQIVPNSHWTRHTSAVDAELATADTKLTHISDMERDEDLAYASLVERIGLLSVIPERMFFIHSCVLPNTTTEILNNLLTKVYATEIYAAVVILQYGLPINIQLPPPLSDTLINTFVSTHTDFFEIPSMRLIQRVCSQITSKYSQHIQVLYLHTKGISYTQRHEEIEDWKDMMTYFLLEQHSANYHLLKSRLFDVIGVNYHSHPRALSGNFWWTTSEYVSGLRRLSYDEDKYAPERWVLTGKVVRVYVPHISQFQHSYRRYPRYCYAPSVFSTLSPSSALGEGGVADHTPSPTPPIPPFSVWKDICMNDREEEYIHLHGNIGGGGQGRGGGQETIKPVAYVLYNP
ncbi:hypothetical protein EON65_53675 [archaeon]|nr:MAG: hypothetical protein EON65_53675 [archaeon]